MTDQVDTVPSSPSSPSSSSAPPRPPRPLRTLCVVGALVVAAVLGWRALQGEATVPYDDPQSGGLLTLCGTDGEPVTGGEVDATPFAPVVLGESGVPADVDARGAVGTVFGYQPREGVAPSEFSGAPLTAAGALVDSDRPAVEVPADAWSLADFVTAYPATWDGYVQLRLYLGAPGAGTLTDRPYDTADIRVEGEKWELVRGGTASCADAASLVAP